MAAVLLPSQQKVPTPIVVVFGWVLVLNDIGLQKWCWLHNDSSQIKYLIFTNRQLYWKTLLLCHFSDSKSRNNTQQTFYLDPRGAWSQA